MPDESALVRPEAENKKSDPDIIKAASYVYDKLV